MSSRQKTKRPTGRVATVLVTIGGILLVGVGAFGIVDYLQRTAVGKDYPDPDQILTHSTERPSERRPAGASDSYDVPADQPRLIRLPFIEAEGYVQQVGIDQTGAIAVPSNIHFAGWYVHGAKPGEEGLSIIDGHVGGRYNTGIFARIGELVPGVTFQIQMGDLSWHEFRVLEVTEYSTENATDALFTRTETVESELKLITCSGMFDGRNQTYDKRTIVTAVHIK